MDASKSSFVTGLAWTMIVLNALGVLLSPLMAPGATGFVSLAISAFLTYAAWALLKRRDWARITYIVFCALAIVLHVVCAAALVARRDTIAELALATAGGGTDVPPEVASVVNVTVTVFAIFLLAMCVLYGWLIRRLLSPAVKAEFAS